MGSEARVTIPEAHEQNSPAERSIREVRQLMNKRCEKEPKRWRVRLPFMQQDLNDMTGRRTSSASFGLMFGGRRVSCLLFRILFEVFEVLD